MRNQSCSLSCRAAIALILVSVSILVIGCAVTRPSFTKISDFNVRTPVRQLAAAYPGHFSKPYTMLVLTDENATCGVTETRWWRDWERFMHERGGAFLLATSKEDSIDLVVAAQLDSTNAPTLVVPLSKRYLKDMGIPIVPLNLLIDSTTEVILLKSAVMDTASSRQWLEAIDSIITSRRAVGETARRQ
ncbi:MAG TPA: hypothetical protein VMS71_04140 [Candidatus Acidoferrum sp.]|nr:hypothetical protein [Candidatus Acidoferrum sp.]